MRGYNLSVSNSIFRLRLGALATATAVCLIGFSVAFFCGYLSGTNGHLRFDYTAAEKVRIAQAEMRILEHVIQNYRTLYGRWPVKYNATEDQTFNSNDVMDVLSGADRSTNPKGINFIVSESNSPMRHDPWGNPYRIRFFNSSLPEAGSTSQALKTRIEIWSDGPGKIKSWEPISAAYSLRTE